MKLLLPLVLCLGAMIAGAQTKNETELSRKQAGEIMEKYRKNASPKVMLTDSIIKRFNRSYLVDKGKPGVYRLKDGMPCVVPDTKDIASIPNAWKGSVKTPYKGKKPAIPNPSQPDIKMGPK